MHVCGCGKGGGAADLLDEVSVEDFVFDASEVCDELCDLRDVDLSLVGQVVTQHGQHLHTHTHTFRRGCDAPVLTQLTCIYRSTAHTHTRQREKEQKHVSVCSLIGCVPVIRSPARSPIWSMLPLWMESDGRCGRKSFPTKKHMNTKSSMHRSKSYAKGSCRGCSPVPALARASRF